MQPKRVNKKAAARQAAPRRRVTDDELKATSGGGTSKRAPKPNTEMPTETLEFNYGKCEY